MSLLMKGDPWVCGYSCGVTGACLVAGLRGACQLLGCKEFQLSFFLRCFLWGSIQMAPHCWVSGYPIFAQPHSTVLGSSRIRPWGQTLVPWTVGVGASLAAQPQEFVHFEGCQVGLPGSLPTSHWAPLPVCTPLPEQPDAPNPGAVREQHPLCLL